MEFRCDECGRLIFTYWWEDNRLLASAKCPRSTGKRKHRYNGITTRVIAVGLGG